MIEIENARKEVNCASCGKSSDVKDIKVDNDLRVRALRLPLCLKCRKILATQLIKELRE